nr:ral guanine nucleotide dissociation stimulator-like [Cavia porcellus]
MKSLDPGTLKKLVNHLVPTHLHGDSSFVPAFLATYRRFATPQQVLDLLFLRLPYLQVTDPRTPRRLLGMPCTISHPEENEYPGDFGQCPDLSLKQLVAYALINLPDSDIILQVCRLPT